MPEPRALSPLDELHLTRQLRLQPDASLQFLARQSVRPGTNL